MVYQHTWTEQRYPGCQNGLGIIDLSGLFLDSPIRRDAVDEFGLGLTQIQCLQRPPTMDADAAYLVPEGEHLTSLKLER
jgi:hypothetical protein